MSMIRGPLFHHMNLADSMGFGGSGKCAAEDGSSRESENCEASSGRSEVELACHLGAPMVEGLGIGLVRLQEACRLINALHCNDLRRVDSKGSVSIEPQDVPLKTRRVGTTRSR